MYQNPFFKSIPKYILDKNSPIGIGQSKESKFMYLTFVGTESKLEYEVVIKYWYKWNDCIIVDRHVLK